MDAAAVDTLNSGKSLVAGVGLTVIAMAAFLVLPLYVGAAAQSLGLDQQEIGFLASATAAGSAISSVAMMFAVRRWPWRRSGRLALLLMLLPMSTSLFTDDFLTFAVLQGLAALGGGACYSLALTALSDRQHPDRAFGMSIAAQVSFQVAGMLLLPQLVGRAGIDGIIGLFVLMELLAFGLITWLPDSGKALSPVARRGSVFSLPTLLALGGCFFFFFNVGAVWTYIERMAVLEGLEAQQIGTGLAVAVSLGIPGALLASWCGDRFGRLGPLAIGAVGTVVALLFLGQGMQLATYIAAVALYNFVWNFSLAFQYAAVNAVDASGRGVAAAPAFHGAGVAVGPAVAALYVTESNLDSVNLVAGIGVILSLLLFTMAIVLSQRAAGKPQSVEV